MTAAKLRAIIQEYKCETKIGYVGSLREQAAALAIEKRLRECQSWCVARDSVKAEVEAKR